MPRQLTDTDIETAVQLLDGWSGKITWDRYLAVLAVELGGVLYTKAGLRKQPRILSAWDINKRRLNNSVADVGAKTNGDAAIAHARKIIERQRNEIERLTQENRDLLERFRRWAYNAAVEKGMTPEQLDKEIVVPMLAAQESGPRPVR